MTDREDIRGTEWPCQLRAGDDAIQRHIARVEEHPVFAPTVAESNAREILADYMEFESEDAKANFLAGNWRGVTTEISIRRH